MERGVYEGELIIEALLKETWIVTSLRCSRRSTARSQFKYHDPTSPSWHRAETASPLASPSTPCRANDCPALLINDAQRQPPPVLGAGNSTPAWTPSLFVSIEKKPMSPAVGAPQTQRHSLSPTWIPSLEESDGPNSQRGTAGTRPSPERSPSPTLVRAMLHLPRLQAEARAAKGSPVPLEGQMRGTNEETIAEKAELQHHSLNTTDPELGRSIGSHEQKPAGIEAQLAALKSRVERLEIDRSVAPEPAPCPTCGTRLAQ